MCKSASYAVHTSQHVWDSLRNVLKLKKVCKRCELFFRKSVILLLKNVLKSFFAYCSKEILIFVQFHLCSNLLSKCDKNCAKLSISFEQKPKNDFNTFLRSKITDFPETMLASLHKLFWAFARSFGPRSLHFRPKLRLSILFLKTHQVLMVLEFSGSSQLEKDPHVRVGVKSIGWKRTFYGCLVIFYKVLRAAHSQRHINNKCL